MCPKQQRSNSFDSAAKPYFYKSTSRFVPTVFQGRKGEKSWYLLIKK